MHDRVPRRLPPAPRPRRVSRAVIAGGAVAALAATALFNGARARAAIKANPPLGHFVEVDGVAVHYLDRGDPAAPPVVLIHGNGSMTQDFVVSGVVDRLAERHRVIVFDRPGSGFSERPRDRDWGAQAQAAVLVAAAASIGIERPVVVGHSWGALVAAAWALDHPDRIGALVLASGYYFPSARPDVLSVVPAVAPVFGDIVQHTIAPISVRLSVPLGNKLIFSPAPVSDAWATRFPFELVMRPSQLHAVLADTAQMPLAAKALVQRYEAIKLPTVIITGDGDKLVPFQAHSKRLAGMLPNARFIVLKGAGHMIQHIDPDAFVAAVEEAAARRDA